MKKKKILLVTDDIRANSGVAHIGRELIFKTCNTYDYCCIAGAMSHPEKGKVIDFSPEVKKATGVENSYVKLYPSEGYGNPSFLRKIIKDEKPDALFLITDPRYFTWIFQMENEIRKTIPIVYLNIWDNVPAPAYNKAFYESVDLLLPISKLTRFVNENVLGIIAAHKIIRYLPHGLDHTVFYPIEKDNPELIEFKKKVTGGREMDFILLFNSRNMRRKSIPDTILAYKMFVDSLKEDEAKKCLLVLHTNPRDENGTDLESVVNYICGNEKYNIAFSNVQLDPKGMNLLYNAADGVILLSSNEGWGLALTESMLTGTPFIANVTGGMQDQMRFEDNGKWFTPSNEVPTNSTKSHLKHGEWAFPVFPSNRSIIGSIPTPYIFEDRCSYEDASKVIKKLWEIGNKSRKEIGLKGREWATSDEAGFTSVKMGERFVEAMEDLFNTWKPREKYELLTTDSHKLPELTHNI